ncbi:MAG TPA: PIN domain-containing protein [Acidimicrobiales bacterium]|nr:PIN domain-containing protein [Acidimicrobiales bacterium]
MSGAVLDTGALIAFDRNDRRVVAIVARALDHGDALVVPAGVVGQAWRDGRTQARLARLLSSPACEIVPLDDHGARAAGQLCGASGTEDVIDATVALLGRQRDMRVITSNPADIRRVDHRLDVVPI